ncbi:molybdate ABC transporter substrate-binding protein [Tellurirhabdus bombi]|uniref:molybdate ABC transporter substrate-binding protein n=1 Tax=Tellurirhabdus bombi TaxID=2907205 RepID=UPI001F1B78E5|nr:molybdate ABC transporter substrate-binding protein [Tellurirhabdus bombi]
MKKIILLFLLLPISLVAQPLRVAVAANAQFMMKELSAAFQKSRGIAVESIVSSSGKLTTQIQQGAPYDVFLSADVSYPQTLNKEGLTLTPPVIYGYGTLVLWTQGAIKLDKNLKFLTDPAVRHIAIANPALAPYGEAAITLIQKQKLLEHLKAKLVYGESISQVNQYILTGSAEIGFTAKSVVLDPSLRQKGRWLELPTSDYQPIAQGVVILKRTTQPAAAKQFIEFLQTQPARRILQKFGYRLPKP